VTLTDSEVEYVNTEAIAKKRTALQIQTLQTLNRISGLPDLEPTSPISVDNKINFSSRQACPERTLSKVENVRLSRSAGNKVCNGRVMKTNRNFFHLKSVNFKKKVAHSSFLSKVLSFLLTLF
jgi:hypothetical protein